MKGDTKMSKIKELFGVEIGEEFTAESKYYGAIKNCWFGGIGKLVVPGKGDWETLDLLTELIMGKAKIVKPILTPDERDYLQAVCNPKYRTWKIVTLRKISNDNGTCYLEIHHETNAGICFSFDFDTDSVFKGMKLNKRYTPEQLGIKL